ncbi:MAG: hypothetical protein V4629_10560 [Pseudomonadota bacterium]
MNNLSKTLMSALSITAAQSIASNSLVKSNTLSSLIAHLPHPSMDAANGNRYLQEIVPSIGLPGTSVSKVATFLKDSQVCVISVEDDAVINEFCFTNIATQLATVEGVATDLEKAGITIVDAYSTHVDADGKLWIGSRGDLSSYDVSTQKIKTFKNVLEGGTPEGMAPITINNISHLAVIDLRQLQILQNGKSVAVLKFEQTPSSVTAFASANGAPLIAIGTLTGGIMIIDASNPSKPIIKQDIAGKDPFALIEDIKSFNQKIFAVQNNQVSVYSQTGETFSLEKSVSVPSASSLIIDEANNRSYLINTNNLIEIYDLQLNKVAEFSSSIEPDTGAMGCDASGNCVLIVAKENGAAEVFRTADIDAVLETNMPTAAPTSTIKPTVAPATELPTVVPTPAPTVKLTPAPIVVPTPAPTAGTTPAPSQTLAPTTAVTPAPTASNTAAPTASVTFAPSGPTSAPTSVKTVAPTAAPTFSPTRAPTSSPTVAPIQQNTSAPTKAPVTPTAKPTAKPTARPTIAPTPLSSTISPVARPQGKDSKTAEIAGGTSAAVVGVASIILGLACLGFRNRHQA